MKYLLIVKISSKTVLIVPSLKSQLGQYSKMYQHVSLVRMDLSLTQIVSPNALPVHMAQLLSTVMVKYLHLLAKVNL
jgi:hypothetical protein